MRLLTGLLFLATFAAHAELINFSQNEIAQIARHGPWPPTVTPDPSNRVSGNPAAIEFGRRLFFEPQLSRDHSLSCASCHVPERAFQDSRATAIGRELVDRNTPSLFNVRLHHWFGWDGAHDSLWSQSIRPLLDSREMNSNAARIARVIRKERTLRRGYASVFGATPGSNNEAVLVNVAKALAAFQETLVTGRAPFDEFRDALVSGNSASAENYPIAAQRGLRVFIGKGKCNVCHLGPNFTNGEFADTGVPFFIAPGKVDPGRYQGIALLKENRFNLLGPYNDDPTRNNATRTRHVAAQHRNFGEFRVPSLRNAARTAPYMHNGRFATLRDVVIHYSELDLDRLHADGERILQPLHLNDQEIGDLVAFLESLSERIPQPR